MQNTAWKAIGWGALYILPLIILSLVLAHSVAHQCWIDAQICLLGILSLLSIATWQIRRQLLGRLVPKQSEAPGDRGVATIVKLLQFTMCGMAAIIIYAIQYDHWKSGGRRSRRAVEVAVSPLPN